MKIHSRRITKAVVEDVIAGMENGNTLNHYAKKLGVGGVLLRRKIIEVVGIKKYQDVFAQYYKEETE